MDLLRPISALLIKADAKDGTPATRRLLVAPPAGAAQREVAVIRITLDGCTFAEGATPLEETALAWLKFPDRAPIRVRIDRATDGSLQCSFAQPLYQADLQELSSHGHPRASRSATTRARCTFVTL